MSRRKNHDKPCRFPGCTETIHWARFFCFKHWRLVPWALQQDMTRISKRDGTHKALELVPGAVKAIERSIANGAGRRS